MSKISLFWQLGPKSAHPKKHYKNRGFSNPFCGRQFWVTKRPFLDKKSQIQKFQLSFFCPFLLLQQQRTQKLAETPIFTVFWQTLKKLQILNWKHRKLKNPIFAPFFLKKAIFRKLPDNWEQKTHNDNLAKKNRLKPQFSQCENDLGPVIDFDLAQLLTLKTPKLGPVIDFTTYIYISLSLWQPLSLSLSSPLYVCYSMLLSRYLSLSFLSWEVANFERELATHMQELDI